MLKEIYSSVNEAIQVETDKNIKLKRRIQGNQVSITFIFKKKGKKTKILFNSNDTFHIQDFFIVRIYSFCCLLLLFRKWPFVLLIYPRVKVIISKNYNIS